MSEVRWGVNSRKIFPRSCNWACTVHWRTLLAVAERFLGVGCSLISSLVFTFDFLAVQWKGGKVCVRIRRMVTCSETRPGRPACPAPCQLPAVPARVWKLAGKPFSSVGMLFAQIVIMWSREDHLLRFFKRFVTDALLQGTVSRDFLLPVFFMIKFPLIVP